MRVGSSGAHKRRRPAGASSEAADAVERAGSGDGSYEGDGSDEPLLGGGEVQAELPVGAKSTPSQSLGVAAAASGRQPSAAGGGDAGVTLQPVPPPPLPSLYRVSCSRLTAVIATTLLALGVIALFVLVVVDAIHTFTTVYFAMYASRWDAVATGAVAWIQTNLRFDASSLTTSLSAVVAQISASSALASILSAIVVAVVTLLFTVFLLLDERLDAGGAATVVGLHDDDAATAASTSMTASPSPARARAPAQPSREARIWAEIDAAIHRYLLAKTLVSVAMGLVVFIVLGPILHVKLAHLWGVLTVVLNFIPNVGAVLAALLPLPVILLDPDLSVAAQVLAIVLPLLVHFVIGNFVEPCLLGPLLQLHPVVVLLSLSFWYVLWGVAGAVLAVPLTSVLAIALKGSRHAYADFLCAILEELRLDLALLADGRRRSAHGGGDGLSAASLGGVDGAVAGDPTDNDVAEVARELPPRGPPSPQPPASSPVLPV